MIFRCKDDDIEKIYLIINEVARAYESAIPKDCYHQPYMTKDELKREMKRMDFFGWEADGELVAIMGIEPIKDVTLIRHAYVLPQWQRRRIGSELLYGLMSKTKTERLLVGTWADAGWAIDFYQKHGFSLLPDKNTLLNTYWNIPVRQIDNSVVLGMNIGKTAKERAWKANG